MKDLYDEEFDELNDYEEEFIGLRLGFLDDFDKEDEEDLLNQDQYDDE